MNKCIVFGIFLLASLGLSIATLMVTTSLAATSAKHMKSSPYSNDSLHEWASETVLRYGRSKSLKGFGPKDVWGAYDLCDHLAFRVEVTGRAKSTSNGGLYEWHGAKWVPIGLGDDYWDGGEGYDLCNACAIVLNGAEW